MRKNKEAKLLDQPEILKFDLNFRGLFLFLKIVVNLGKPPPVSWKLTAARQNFLPVAKEMWPGNLRF